MTRTVGTTIALPTDVLAQVDEAVRRGAAGSRDEFVVTALRRELAARERAAIDADFAGMSEDEDYRREAQLIAEEFKHADWEALRLGEAAATSFASHS
jgi:Arc/MetJ-type ribon-helix-helix transcriptional regulator